MVIFSTNKKSWKKGKNCLHKDDVGKNIFTEENFSYPPPEKKNLSLKKFYNSRLGGQRQTI